MRSAEAIVIGGGVIGAAILYALTKRGFRDVVLLEKDRFANGSTGQSGGFIRVYHPDPELSDLAADSFASFLRFEEEVGETCGYVPTGLLYLEPPDRLPHMLAEVERLQQRGVSVEAVLPEVAPTRFPTMRWQGVGGAVYESAGGYADPVLTTRAWIRWARDRGATACEGTQVFGLIVQQGRVTGVETNIGTIHAPLVILAAGAWSQQLVKPHGVDLPVRSKTIQVHFYKRPEGMDHPAFIDETTDLYARPDASGISLVGYPVDEWDIDPDVRRPIQLSPLMSEVAPTRLGWVEPAQLTGGRCSFDGYSTDRKGILAFSSDLEGLLFATGWSGGGFKVAPGVGERTADLILERSSRS